MSFSPVSLLFSQPAAVVPPRTPALTPLRPMTNHPDPICHQAETADVIAWCALVQQFGETRIRKHQWEWVTSSQSWLPHYRFKSVQKITQIWNEYSDGIDGCLSIRELNVTWGPRWKRNIAGLKSETTRRNKLVDLIQKLAGKHRWDTKLALRFVCERYEAKYSPRAFCDYLHTHLSEVLKAAESYP
jgi:Transcriptional activator of glycolytic enzymes